MQCSVKWKATENFKQENDIIQIIFEEDGSGCYIKSNLEVEQKWTHEAS